MMDGYVGDSWDNQDYAAYADEQAQQYGIDPTTFLDQLGVESNWNPNAVSSSGAFGIGQVLPSTAANPGFGVSPLEDSSNPYSQIAFAAQYMGALQQQTGSLGGALTAYNVGIGGNATNLSSEYQQLVAGAQNVGVNGSGVQTGCSEQDPNCMDEMVNAATSGGYNETPTDIAAGQAVAASLSPASWLPGLENWASQSLLNAAVIVIGVVFLLVGLFMLAGGKPRDVVAAVGEAA